jgi:hypothetical protein
MKRVAGRVPSSALSYRSIAAIREHNTFDVNNAYLSISTDGPLPLSPDHVASMISHPTRSEHETSVFVSRGNDGTQPELLARAVSAKDRPLSSWFWSDEFVSASTGANTVNLTFERRLLRGVTNMGPPPPSWSVRNPRVRGSLRTKRRPRLFHECGIDIDARRRRQIGLTVERAPFLGFASLGTLAASDSMHIFHNAVRAELRDLHRIVMSLETRLVDVDDEDIRSFYAWLDGFGDFLRLYLAASERFVISVAEDASDIEFCENMLGNRRRNDKVQIVRMLEGVENLKRPMQARPDRQQLLLAELRAKVDDLTMAIIRCLSTEAEQLPSVLSSHFHEQQITEMFSRVKARMLESASGPLLLVALSRGSGHDVETRKKWLKTQSQQLIRSKTSAKAAVQKWTRTFLDIHKEYVLAFVSAKKEYVDMYTGSRLLHGL